MCWMQLFWLLNVMSVLSARKWMNMRRRLEKIKWIHKHLVICIKLFRLTCHYHVCVWIVSSHCVEYIELKFHLKLLHFNTKGPMFGRFPWIFIISILLWYLGRKVHKGISDQHFNKVMMKNKSFWISWITKKSQSIQLATLNPIWNSVVDVHYNLQEIAPCSLLMQ